MKRIFVLVFLFVLATVDGNHFLGGTITWRVLNASATGTPVAVVITQMYLWTYSEINCTDDMIANDTLIPVGTHTTLLNDTLDCIYNCGIGSAGYVAPLIRPYCTDSSATSGTTVG